MKSYVNKNRNEKVTKNAGEDRREKCIIFIVAIFYGGEAVVGGRGSDLDVRQTINCTAKNGYIYIGHFRRHTRKMDRAGNQNPRRRKVKLLYNQINLQKIVLEAVLNFYISLKNNRPPNRQSVFISLYSLL